MMNNETVKKVDITIKLRGDNMYDLYVNDNWSASRGSCDSILEDLRAIVRDSLMND